MSYPPHASPSARTVQRPSRWLRVAVGGVVLALVCWAVAEPIWLRPFVRHYVRQHAGRQIDFDRLQLRLDGALQPVFRIHRLRIENAPWAAARPLITAREVDVTVGWHSFEGPGAVLPLVVIVEADIDLEQQTDGLRNWRLADPQDRGPGHIRIASLQAIRSQLRMVNRDRDLELDLATTPLPAAERLTTPAALPMTEHLHIEGRYRQARFAGDFSVAAVLSLFDTGTPFPLRGRLESGGTTLSLEGLAHDLLQLGGFDVAAHLVSTDLAASARPMLTRPAFLPATSAEGRARLRKDADHWQATDLQATLGRSDLSGGVDLQRPADASRSLLHAELSSRRIDFADLHRAFAGEGVVVTAAVDREQGPSPVADNFAAEVDLSMARIDNLPLGSSLASIDSVASHASWRAGRLTIRPLSFGVSGGHATGQLTIDTTLAPTDTALDLAFTHLRLDRITAARSAILGIEGGLDLHLQLQSRGDSLATLRNGAFGKVTAKLQHASLPASLDARLALDAGQWLRTFADPDKRMAILCSIGEMRIESGRGRTTRMVIETENVVVSGHAQVDLKQKSFEMVLTPHRKQSALMALDRSVRVGGGFHRPSIGLVDKAEPGAPADCRRDTAH